MCEFASTLLARTNSVQISCSKFGIHLLSLQTWVNPFFRPVEDLKLLTNLYFPHFLHNFLNLYPRMFAIMISLLTTFWLLNNTSTICRRPYFYCLKRKSRYCKSNANCARNLIIWHRYASYPMNTRTRKIKPKPTLTNFSIK